MLIPCVIHLKRKISIRNDITRSLIYYGFTRHIDAFLNDNTEDIFEQRRHLVPAFLPLSSSFSASTETSRSEPNSNTIDQFELYKQKKRTKKKQSTNILY